MKTLAFFENMNAKMRLTEKNNYYKVNTYFKFSGRNVNSSKFENYEIAKQLFINNIKILTE